MKVGSLPLVDEAEALTPDDLVSDDFDIRDPQLVELIRPFIESTDVNIRHLEPGGLFYQIVKRVYDLIQEYEFTIDTLDGRIEELQLGYVTLQTTYERTKEIAHEMVQHYQTVEADEEREYEDRLEGLFDFSPYIPKHKAGITSPIMQDSPTN